MNWLLVGAMSVAGFVFGLVATGHSKKPKVPVLYLSFPIGKNRIHVHHWMWVGAALLILVALMLSQALDSAALWLNIIFGFGFGYMCQGFFVKDAFKIWNYDLRMASKKFKGAWK